MSLVTADDVRLARLERGAPRVPWQVFTGEHFRWQHGEHVALIGPTGQGKTTLLRSLLPLHPYTTIFVTKPRDDSMSRFFRDGYQRLDRWQSIDPRMFPRRVLWPDATGLYSATNQQETFANAMDKIYKEGAWSVAVDELWYLTNRLKLGGEVKTYLTQARSLDVSMVNLTQRPAWVPTEVYDQSTHLFLWRNNDGRSQERLSEINAIDRRLVRDVVSDLETHQTLYINTRSGEMFRTRAPVPTDNRGEVAA